jgi:hypothetical protein
MEFTLSIHPCRMLHFMDLRRCKLAGWFLALKLCGAKPIRLQGLIFFASCLASSRNSGGVKLNRKNSPLPNQVLIALSSHVRNDFLNWKEIGI